MGVVAERLPYSRDAPVLVERGETMHEALGRVLEGAGLEHLLAARCGELGVTPETLRVAIKINLMTGAGAEAPPASFTGPETLDALAAHLEGHGYTGRVIVESPTSADPARSVASVASALGYGDHRELVDLSAEPEPFDYGGTLGQAEVGAAWRNANFRISLAPCKTSALLGLSGSLANVFGTLPGPDKRAYAVQGGTPWETCRSVLDALPVDFGVIDAWRSRDGSGWDPGSGAVRSTATMLASPNLFALDWVTAELMGVDPSLSPLLREGVLRWGRIDISRRGNLMGWDPFRAPGPGVLASAGLLASGPFARLTEGRCGWTIQ